MSRIFKNILKTALILMLAIGSGATVAIHALNSEQEVVKNASFYTYKVHIGDSGSGTGFRINGPDGTPYIITNEHVCVHNGQLSDNIYIYEGRDRIKKYLTPYKTSMHKDLCALKIVTSDIDGGIPISSADIALLDEVMSFGFPHGGPLNISRGYLIEADNKIEVPTSIIREGTECPYGLKPEFGMGIMGEPLVRCWITHKLYVSTLYAAPGASGSPVLNKYGQVIGVVNVAGYNRAYFIKHIDLLKFYNIL